MNNRYLVLDCSFFMSFTLPDENGNNNNISSYNIIVPSIFYLECLNVLHIALRRNRINDTNFQEYLHILKNFPCKLDQFSSSCESVLSIAQLSNKFDITSYDASYLELALRHNAIMATHDKKLITICKKANIDPYSSTL